MNKTKLKALRKLHKSCDGDKAAWRRLKKLYKGRNTTERTTFVDDMGKVKEMVESVARLKI